MLPEAGRVCLPVLPAVNHVEYRSPTRPASFGPRMLDRPARRFGMPVVDRKAAVWNGAEGELITGGTCGPHEIEILLPSHTVCMRCEGSSPGYEWSDGSNRQKVESLRPETVLFAPAQRYAWVGKRSHAGGTFLVLCIDPDEFNALSDDGFDASRVEFLPRAELDIEPVRRTLFAIRDEIATPGPGERLYRSLLVQQLLIQLARCASNLAPERRFAYVKGGLSGWQLRRSLELLEADLTEPPSLRQLAAHVGLSPTHFCKAFKQSTGMPPHRWLTNRRIAHAKELIARRRLSLTEVALSAGFGSSSRFSVAFKSAVGVAPSVYKRAL